MSQKDRSRQRSKKLACILCAVCAISCLLSWQGVRRRLRTPPLRGIVYDDAAIEGGLGDAERGGDRGQPQREGGGGVHQHLHERLPRL